jgi:hypothetical protein
MKLVQDRQKIYWTPNTISSKVMIEGNLAHIELTSETPNLKEFQMNELPSYEWKTTEEMSDKNLRTINMSWYSGLQWLSWARYGYVDSVWVST